MNKRSFKRGMEPPELKEGWTRRVLKNDKQKANSLEQALRDIFEEILRNALAEMEKQNKREYSAPFNSWAQINWGGAEIRLSIESKPPQVLVDPSLN